MNDRYLYRANHIHALSENNDLTEVQGADITNKKEMVWYDSFWRKERRI